MHNVFNIYAIIRKLLTFCHFPDCELGKIIILYLGNLQYIVTLPVTKYIWDTRIKLKII